MEMVMISMLEENIDNFEPVLQYTNGIGHVTKRIGRF